MIAARDVVWIFDETTRPSKRRMVACVHPGNGWYYRINTNSHWRPSVPIKAVPEHTFLSHDSYLECGEPLEMDDYVIEEAIHREGIIGTIHATVVEAIIQANATWRPMRQKDRDAICAALLGQ